jgi:hypothetical protein
MKTEATMRVAHVQCDQITKSDVIEVQLGKNLQQIHGGEFDKKANDTSRGASKRQKH